MQFWNTMWFKRTDGLPDLCFKQWEAVGSPTTFKEELSAQTILKALNFSTNIKNYFGGASARI